MRRNPRSRKLAPLLVLLAALGGVGAALAAAASGAGGLAPGGTATLQADPAHPPWGLVLRTNATCGAPGVTPTLGVQYYGVTAKPGAPPFKLDHVDDAAAVETVRYAGVRVFARVTVICSQDVTTTDTDGTTGTTTQEKSAVLTTNVVTTPPALAGHAILSATYCGPALKNAIQAKQTAYIRYTLAFSPRSLFADSSSLSPSFIRLANLRHIRLFARGAGVSVSRAPDRYSFRFDAHAFALGLAPRRAGTLRIWATVAGMKTNAQSVRVAAARHGC